MKCSRCGEEGIIKAVDIEILEENLGRRVVLCEKCIDKLNKFLKEDFDNSEAYVNTMYNEVWENEV